jgi:hypothetical protein
MKEGTMHIVHSLRNVAALALLGAVLTGVVTSGLESQAFDVRILGAIVGAGAGIVALMMNSNRP